MIDEPREWFFYQLEGFPMNSTRIHLIACGVLRLDMNDVLDRLGTDLGFSYDTTYLEGGLHSDPARLRRELQLAVDAVDDGPADRIVLGYGLCGRGTVGIAARSKPLSIPRVHDCIALFLGADSAYRREFAKCPGTYYISAGWYDEKVQPRGSATPVSDPGSRRAEQAEIDRYASQYGEDNAREIVRFLSSWQRNYRRAAFIDTGSGEPERYAGYARAMADAFGWEYERIEGRQTLLEKAVRGDTADGDILNVNPGFVTEFDAKERKLVALPPAKLAGGSAGGTTPGSYVTQQHADESKPAHAHHAVGIGIDAGGTYTDAVVFDFGDRTVLDRGKALTTKWDYAEGIEEALRQLDERWFSRVDLVSVSTTLATNAIVEGNGQSTGLIVMPNGYLDPEELHQPAAVVTGSMTISGDEIEPIDTQQVASVARNMLSKQGVAAFAVSGYGGSVNPAHEIEVKRVIREITGCDVCCGHEFSNMLDFRIRANTAVLNAGIIPLLERFIADVDTVLERIGVQAPIMVVKGDGTLMDAAWAREHPVETVLSGPAASIAGARYLTDCPDATVIDVGGTTSDIGKITRGEVRICEDGAQVGSWRTHVRAIDMKTVGLGGDSEIAFEKQALRVGPHRIAPVCWLASKWTRAGWELELEWLADRVDDFSADTRLAELFWLTGRTPDAALDSGERRILEALSDGPLSTLHLVERTGCGHYSLLRTARLESEHLVQRCGLTPTDMLHVSGALDLWEPDISRRYAQIIASVAGIGVVELSDRVMRRISETLIFELVHRQLDLEGDGADLEHAPTARGIVDVLLSGGNHHLNVNLELNEPVIGLGAAAPLLVHDAARHLHASFQVPQYADVANAVGAITSLVAVSRTGSIIPSPDGSYQLVGVPGGEGYESFEEAHRRLLELLETSVIADAAAAGTDETRVEYEVLDRMSHAADGAELFLERRVIARVTGVPR